MCESLEIRMGVKQGCVMLPLLFNMDGTVKDESKNRKREKAQVGWKDLITVD